MKKNSSLILFITILTVFIIEVGLRFLGYREAYNGVKKYIPVIKPASFFIKDDLLGWSMCYGKFDFYIGDSLLFTCNIGADRNRIINRSDVLLKSKQNNNQQKKISLYGCSYTFGQSVSDTSNYPFYLQSMLPNYSISNRGVPGYSLVQILLSIKQDVENGNKPSIAIINYASFLDERTVLDKSWLNRFKWALKYGAKEQLFEINYPYAKHTVNDSLVIDYLKWNDWSEDWILRDKSALINLANTAYNNFNLKIHQEDYYEIVLHCLDYIFNYCNNHGVKVVFYGLNKNSKPVLEYLKSKGAITKLSSVDIHTAGFNCGPFDPIHPNSKAHKIYANEVFDCLELNNIINSVE